MANIYELVRELRREHPSPSAARTLDMVVAELGRTHDNLREAMAQLELRPVPTGGQAVLEELGERARAWGVDDVQAVPSHEERDYEPIDESEEGIAFLLGLSSVVLVVLAVAAIAVGLH